MRLLLGLAAVFVLAGCGAATNGSGKPAASSVPGAPAPPIVPLDEAPPAEVGRMIDALTTPLPSGGSNSGVDSVTFTFTWGPGGTSTTQSSQQTADALAKIDAERAATAPAPGSSPRAVARLPLADGGDALFVTWHHRAGALCSTTWISHENGGGGGSGCDDASLPSCTAICLESSGGGPDESDMVRLLSGTVAADADTIDVTTADGTTTAYPLTGPLVDGDRRVFMLELGSRDWRTLVLLRNGDAVDRTAMPKGEVAVDECDASVPSPPAATPGSTAYTDAMNACLAEHGAGPTP
ncbi:MAG TPA: hypothetical protein VMJ49_03850 [Gaiellaceae bacterium]|nr:hypothetical protein [Gaiellaceae bacterium]